MRRNHLSIFLGVLAAAAPPSVHAFGQARVVNKCAFPVWLWTVGESAVGAFVVGASGGTYSEPMTIDPVTCGRSIKITVSDHGLYTGAPQMDFAYNLDDDDVWYDLSDMFGHPLEGHNVTLASGNSDCPALIWSHGVSPPGSQVRRCYSTVDDLVLTLCA